MNARYLLIVLFGLSGCASLSDAGISTYEISPLADGACCRVLVRSGREIARVDARLLQTERGPEVRFSASDVRAFEGQKAASEVAERAIAAIERVLPDLVGKAVAAALGTKAIESAGAAAPLIAR